MSPSNPCTLVACVLTFLLTAPAAAQSRPTRAMFEAAVLSEAATVVPPRQCSSDGGGPEARPELRIPRAKRARVLGRQLSLARSPLASGAERRRRVALVRIASGVADANDDLAYRLLAVVLRSDGGGPWQPDSHTELALGDAPFDYEDGAVKIFRLDDVDDDGERELQVVLETNTEVQCGTGYCNLRRTVLLDTGDPGLPVVANVATRLECVSVMDQFRGTVLFRDSDDDGHRDLLVRRQDCRAGDDDLVCDRRTTTAHRWVEASDRYEPNPGGPSP